MKKSNLKLVEKLSNFEIINLMKNELEELIDDLNDDSSSLVLRRNFIPEDKDLKKVQNGLSSLLDSKIHKPRGSNELMSIESEILLTPSNEEEKETIDIIVNYFERKVDAISFLLGKYGQYLVHHLYEDQDESHNGHNPHSTKVVQPELTNQRV